MIESDNNRNDILCLSFYGIYSLQYHISAIRLLMNVIIIYYHTTPNITITTLMSLIIYDFLLWIRLGSILYDYY